VLWEETAVLRECKAAYNASTCGYCLKQLVAVLPCRAAAVCTACTAVADLPDVYIDATCVLLAQVSGFEQQQAQASTGG
jgi:hypothetical protein